MIIRNGHFFGKGTVLVDGATIGERVEVDLEIAEDHGGLTLSGRVLEDKGGEISIRVAPDEVGTYVLDARVGSFALDGVAKLESEPNLALLWNEGGTQSVSVTLFAAGSGVGCRGFLHEDGKTRTWEILFKLKQQVVGGDNVVTLRRR